MRKAQSAAAVALEEYRDRQRRQGRERRDIYATEKEFVAIKALLRKLRGEA